MNWPHVHLMVNHIPVLGTMFGLALLSWGILRRNVTLQRVALATFVVAAIAAIPVYLTGEPAEHVVEHLPGTADQAIETHERAALVSLIAVGVLGLIAAIGLFRGGPRAATAWIATALAVAFATAGLLARTATLGGQIRHAELRDTTAPRPADDGTRERRHLEREGSEGR